MNKLLYTISLLTASVLSSPVFAQTSLVPDGGDTPSGFSFANQQNTPQVIEQEVNFDSVIAQDQPSKATTSPFVVQISYSPDVNSAEAFKASIKAQNSDLLQDNTIHIEPESNGVKVVVDGFDSKAVADQWCDRFKNQSGNDCLVLNRAGDRASQRIAELAEAIKSGMSTDTVSVSSIPLADLRVDSAEDIGDLKPQKPVMVHQFQRAWEQTDERTAVFEANYCATCVYKMNLRELMVSNFELPRGEVIIGFDIGDPTIFDAEIRGDNRLAIMSKAYGTDTNIQVYTESGRVYPVYVRSLDVQSPLLPDLVFRVLDASISYTEVKRPKTIPEAADLIVAPPEVNASKLLTNLKPQNISEADFLKEIPFDVGKLRFDGFKVWGSADRKLMPSRVFRDDKHIYIQYDDVSRLPGFAAYSVFDGIDERIGSRVSGNTFIIKGIGDMISLKSGNSYLCIELAREV